METLFYRGRERTEAVLKRSQELRESIKLHVRVADKGVDEWHEADDHEIDVFIDQLVDTRANCAHLRDHNSFGYAPGDRAVIEKVKPLLETLDGIVREMLLRRMETAKAAATGGMG